MLSDIISTNKAKRKSTPLLEIDFEEVNDFLCLSRFAILLCTMLQANSIGTYIRMFMFQHIISSIFKDTTLSFLFSTRLEAANIKS